jgi:hypothetical protein
VTLGDSQVFAFDVLSTEKILIQRQRRRDGVMITRRRILYHFRKNEEAASGIEPSGAAMVRLSALRLVTFTARVQS